MNNLDSTIDDARILISSTRQDITNHLQRLREIKHSVDESVNKIDGYCNDLDNADTSASQQLDKLMLERAQELSEDN
jgi:ribosome recycling factor